MTRVGVRLFFEHQKNLVYQAGDSLPYSDLPEFHWIKARDPDTCESKCNVQDFKCKNSRKSTLSVMLDSSCDRLTEPDTVFNSDDSGKIFHCNSIVNKMIRKSKCQKILFWDICSESCCNAGFFSVEIDPQCEILTDHLKC